MYPDTRGAHMDLVGGACIQTHEVHACGFSWRSMYPDTRGAHMDLVGGACIQTHGVRIWI